MYMPLHHVRMCMFRETHRKLIREAMHAHAIAASDRVSYTARARSRTEYSSCACCVGISSALATRTVRTFEDFQDVLHMYILLHVHTCTCTIPL